MDLVLVMIIWIATSIKKIDNVILKKIKDTKFTEIISFTSDEPSLLQCAQRCRFTDPHAAVDFRNFKCRCIKYQTDDEQINQRSLTDVFVKQMTMKYEKPKLVPICYGARNEDYGEFIAPKTGQTRAIRLTHQSGKVMCTPAHGGRWGCSWDKSGRVFRIFITDKDKNKIFPVTGGFKYNVDNYNINDDEIIIRRTTAYKVNKGQVFLVWDGGDLENHSDDDNSGKHCIFADIIYEKEA